MGMGIAPRPVRAYITGRIDDHPRLRLFGADPPASHKCYTASVEEVPLRELRNHVSSVLRRVEAGERIRVTVSGRPVAELTPLAARPRSIPWEAFIQGSEDWRADPQLARELAVLLPDTTDELRVP